MLKQQIGEKCAKIGFTQNIIEYTLLHTHIHRLHSKSNSQVFPAHWRRTLDFILICSVFRARNRWRVPNLLWVIASRYLMKFGFLVPRAFRTFGWNKFKLLLYFKSWTLALLEFTVCQGVKTYVFPSAEMVHELFVLCFYIVVVCPCTKGA